MHVCQLIQIVVMSVLARLIRVMVISMQTLMQILACQFSSTLIFSFYKPGLITLVVSQAAKQDDSKPAFHYSDNKESLYRPPTSEELNSLKETESLFHSSLLHMQINELLAEVCLRKRRKKLEETLHSLNELLMSLPDGDQQDVSTPYIYLITMELLNILN